MDGYEWWKEVVAEDWDEEELEFIYGTCSLSSLESEDLELEEFVDQLTSEILYKAHKQLELELQVQLEVQLEEAGVLWGPDDVEEAAVEAAGVGQLPGCVPVEFADEEPQVRIVCIEEDREQELPQEELQTKSWWRRQADRLWKATKSAGNFCLAVICCQGLRRCMRQVGRSDLVLPV